MKTVTLKNKSPEGTPDTPNFYQDENGNYGSLLLILTEDHRLGKLSCLSILRREAPRGYALPGGRRLVGESAEETAVRATQRKLSLKIDPKCLKHMGCFYHKESNMNVDVFSVLVDSDWLIRKAKATNLVDEIQLSCHPNDPILQEMVISEHRYFVELALRGTHK
jgi:ADP-ribose pyrophosphatase YjhB (NUDIX family)